MQEKDIEEALRFARKNRCSKPECMGTFCATSRAIEHLVLEVSVQAKTISALQTENVGILQRNRELQDELESQKCTCEHGSL